jgi:hypothetical protein
MAKTLLLTDKLFERNEELIRTMAKDAGIEINPDTMAKYLN